MQALNRERAGLKGRFCSVFLQVQPSEPDRYDLDTRVEVWSDFLRLHLHPKSLLMLPRYFHNE